MKALPRQNLAQQTSAHLREGVRTGRWSGKLPGVLKLSEELGVSKGTVRDALKMLESDGCLRANRPGQRRSITAAGGSGDRPLRVGVLLNEPLLTDNSHSQRLIHGLTASIEAAGHVFFHPDSCIQELGANPRKVARMVRAAPADAWFIYRSPREVLTWFATEAVPSFAIGGRSENLPLSSTRSEMSPGVITAVETLSGLGHQRIVYVTPARLRKPDASPCAAAFLGQLRRVGLPATAFNLPDWEETPAGLQKLLEELFFATPPTALLFVEPDHALGTLSYLAHRGLRVPEDVSVFCAFSDPILDWHVPALASLVWPTAEKHVRNGMRWLRAVASGAPGLRQYHYPCEFDAGKSIGPARRPLSRR